jgi:hypothetical protein
MIAPACEYTRSSSFSKVMRPRRTTCGARAFYKGRRRVSVKPLVAVVRTIFLTRSFNCLIASRWYPSSLCFHAGSRRRATSSTDSAASDWRVWNGDVNNVRRSDRVYDERRELRKAVCAVSSSARQCQLTAGMRVRALAPTSQQLDPWRLCSLAFNDPVHEELGAVCMKSAPTPPNLCPTSSPHLDADYAHPGRCKSVSPALERCQTSRHF